MKNLIGQNFLTNQIKSQAFLVRKMIKAFYTIRYALYCINWMWKNKNWNNTRQKFKAMEREYHKRYTEKYLF